MSNIPNGHGVCPAQTSVIIGSGGGGGGGATPPEQPAQPLKFELRNPRWKHNDSSKEGDPQVDDEVVLEVDVVVLSGKLEAKKLTFQIVDTACEPHQYIGVASGDITNNVGSATWKVEDVFDLKEEREISIMFRAKLRGEQSPEAELPVESYLELNLHNDDLTPADGAPYEVMFANGAVRRGNLDSNGHVRLENVPAGMAEVRYGDVHRPFTPASVKVQKVTDEGLANDIRTLGLDPDSVDITQLIELASGRLA